MMAVARIQFILYVIKFTRHRERCNLAQLASLPRHLHRPFEPFHDNLRFCFSSARCTITISVVLSAKIASIRRNAIVYPLCQLLIAHRPDAFCVGRWSIIFCSLPFAWRSCGKTIRAILFAPFIVFAIIAICPNVHAYSSFCISGSGIHRLFSSLVACFNSKRTPLEMR